MDSKFGSAIETGQAEEITLFTLRQPHVELVGFHCHVGSQVFAEDVFERAAVIMLEFAAHMEKAHGYQTRQLDLGGGYGVRYVECDPVLDVDAEGWPRWPPRPRAPAPAWASPCPRFTWSPDAASWETRD